MGFWRFADEHSLGGLTALLPSYDPVIGWIAGTLAVIAGLALFPTLDRLRTSPAATARLSWLAAGAVTLTIGFWGTQNMALAGMVLPARYHYVPAAGFAALLPCLAGCLAALHLLGQPRPGPAHRHAAAASLALGVSGMHYALMAALAGDLIVVYDPGLSAMSLGLGYGSALLAVYATCSRTESKRWQRVVWPGGILMLGFMVLGSHFTAMAGTSFFDDPAIASTGVARTPALMTPLLLGCVLFLVVALWIGSVIDRRLAGASTAVRRSEAVNRAIVDTMLDPHVVIDACGTVTAFNPAAELVFGWQAAEVIGQGALALFHAPAGSNPRNWWVNGARLTGLSPNRRRWVYPQGGQRKDGSAFPIELAISPFTVDGQRYYSCTVRDLSERWDAEARLRRLAAAVEHAGDGIVILDTSHRIRYVNPQFERQSGFSQDDVAGLEPGRDLGEDTVYGEIWRTVATGRVWTGQVRSRRRDGRSCDEELTVTPVFDTAGAISGYVAVTRDITRRLEAGLERRRLAEALQHCTDSIGILDAQGCIVYVNAAFENSSGQRLGDIRGSRPEALLDFTLSGDAYDDMVRTAFRGARPWSGTLTSTDTHGVTREEDVTVSPMRDERDQVHGYVFVKRDTTDRRRLEAQAQQRQQLASMGQMAAGIARELARPVQQLGDTLGHIARSCAGLDSLLGEIETLAQGTAAVAPAVIAGCLQNADADFRRLEIGRALGQANDSVARLTGIVGAMRDISYASPEMAGVDLNRAIQSTITVCTSEWREAAEIRTTFDPALPAVTCIAGDISLVVMNMLAASAQAIVAANHSGIRGKGVITVSTQRVHDWAEIRISHTGRGVAPQDRAALFTAAGDGRAPGLGLAHDVVVRRHSGTIALESDGRSGATFIVRLPLESAAAATTATAAA